MWLAAGQWFSLGTPISSTNKTDLHNITEMLLKVVLNTIPLTQSLYLCINNVYENKEYENYNFNWLIT